MSNIIPNTQENTSNEFKLMERVPLDRALFVMEMKFSDFKTYSKRCKNDIERREQFDKLKRLCQEYIFGSGVVERKYAHSQNMKSCGRLFSNGIQGVMREFRGFLLGTTTTDIDMKNAHPVILRYICKINNIPCPNLEYYINNRDSVLDSFKENLSKEDAKKLFLVSINKVKHFSVNLTMKLRNYNLK